MAGIWPAGIVYAQQAISAQSGMVHFVEGTVYANGQPVVAKFGQFPAVREGQDVRTEDGRAEVLLTPGAFLRLADHSSVRMLSNRLTDTRLEVLKGSVMVECDELLKDNSLSVIYQDKTIRLEKHGLYRLDTEPARFRVYDGIARIQSDGLQQITLKRGKEAALEGLVLAQEFNTRSTDSMYLWSRQRSSTLAYASISAAQSLLDNRTSWTAGGWLWSPLLDEFTFVPRSGYCYSPFGARFWSPVTLGYYYTPYYDYSGYRAANGRGNPNPSAAAEAIVHRPAPAIYSRGAAVSGWDAGIRSGGGYAGGYNSGGGGYSGYSGGAPTAAVAAPSAGVAAPAVIHTSGSGRATQTQ
ncbi:MAG: hypothetical protein C5B51_03990 [Terriglobia bacterium]|nr:MAG: hypothetical protein C5B51_03990 [Terriglobia bacterium]